MMKDKETPLMKQFNAIKAKYPGTILLFRVGDFYETFGEDAVQASRVLGIVLTKRANGAASEMELAGFPHHSLDSYLPKLVKAGLRVAVCDQLEDPKLAKGIVKRGVTDLVTPGVVLSDKVLDQQKNNYLCALWFESPQKLGSAFLDISTGEFFCRAGDPETISRLVHSLNPSETIVSRKDMKSFRELFGEKLYHHRMEDWAFAYDTAFRQLTSHFGTVSLKGFGLDDTPLEIIPSGAILIYLEHNEQKNISHINRIYRFEENHFLGLDPFTIRNLELFNSAHPDGVSLFKVINKTQTVMGARLMQRWLAFPLLDPKEIQKRLDCVEAYIRNPSVRDAVGKILGRISDMERLCAKLATLRLSPRDAAFLRNANREIGPLVETLANAGEPALNDLVQGFRPPEALLRWFDDWLAEEPSPALTDGKIIKEGNNSELDELRSLLYSGKEYLLELQQREITRTGITSLKVAYNNVFGYYIEITHAHKDKVPSDYIRKQTLTNAERYITPELKTYEEKILTAEEKILKLESGLYQDFISGLMKWIPDMQHNARMIATADVLYGFAVQALSAQYCRPEVNEGETLDITEGRHPVIETVLSKEHPYIPNSVKLDNSTQQIIIITGPNMAGKSALLRQTALIVLMAQAGSYVPASAAQIGIADRIFTRVGASDNLSAGESTFMVEMNETARILNTCTSRSLILMDEIGRGTSTYDGVSIAWSLVEYLHETQGRMARTLFATHYHELNDLEGKFSRVKNFNVSVREAGGRILFLRKLIPGGTEHSFGIQVAEMAGMPRQVSERARELLTHFESRRQDQKEAVSGFKFSNRQEVQLNMFELRDEDTLKIRRILAGCDIDRMTPVEALLKLQEIKRELSGEN